MAEELKTIDTIDTSPFKKLVMTIGELPTSFVDSMTYYELLAWLCNYLQNTVIPAVNNNAEVSEELQEKFIELKGYVDNYFDNLDVQDEINNKLDAMLEDGTLETILQNYAELEKIYPTTTALTEAEDLVKDMKVRTLGYSAINDGGAGEFVITDTEDTTKFQIQIGTLYAELINPTSFKQMGKFTTDITATEFGYITSPTVDLEGNTLTLSETLNVANKTIINGEIAMGTASASVAPSHDVCLAVGSNVTIKNVKFENIDAYYTILSNRGSKNINILDCTFIDNAFACVVFDVGNENIKVDGCHFDGIKYTVTSSLAYRYFIATGSKYTQEQNAGYTFGVRNAEFTNNTCLNNPLWEGIDTHGGENIRIANNYIYNCQTGIMAGSGGALMPTMKHCNIVIENNVIDGTNATTRCGIYAGGDPTNTFFAENIRIVNNKLDNSSTHNANFGAITLKAVTGFAIVNNKITRSTINGIYFGTKCIDGEVNGNYIENAGTGVIRQAGYAFLNVAIVNNTFNGLGSATYAMENTLEGKGKFDNNIVFGCSTNYIHNAHFFCATVNGSTNGYTTLNEILLDTTNNKVYKVTSTYLAFGRSAFRKTMTATGEQGLNYVTCSTNPEELVAGLAITIGGDDYTIDHVDGTRIYLTTNTSNQYTAATIAPKQPTLTAIINA